MKKIKIFCVGMVSIVLLSGILPVVTLALEVSESSEEVKGTESQSIVDNAEKTTEKMTNSVQPSEEEIQSEEMNRDVEKLELDEDLANNPYFPSNPTEEDIIGSKVKPGEIPLPAENMQRGVSKANQYVISRNYPNPAIKTSYKGFPKMNYKDGAGKPRGVVVHETANSKSSIWNEIEHMTNNWNNAFVHAFVDKDNIVEIHPTNYSVWGAGAQANPYFIQVELVEHLSSWEDFYRSLNNDAYYVAYNLKKYNLTPSRSGGGPGNPTGTVWSHHEVSSRLGGTNHTDPTGYFAQFSYTFTEFYELVEYKFKQINAANITSDVAFNSAAGIVKNG